MQCEPIFDQLRRMQNLHILYVKLVSSPLGLKEAALCDVARMAAAMSLDSCELSSKAYHMRDRTSCGQKTVSQLDVICKMRRCELYLQTGGFWLTDNLLCLSSLLPGERMPCALP